jgi:16S rRNA (uracil1498-N3)-methyltransferase
MARHRFYLAPAHWREERPELSAKDAHHCTDVLRLGVGEHVVIFDGEGHEATAELLDVNRKHVWLKIEHRTAALPPRCSITLAQAVPKARNMDLIIQKGVELGASAIMPILSERTVLRLEDAEDGIRKQERWQSIALEACKQSGQNWMPAISPPRTIKDFLSDLPKKLAVDLFLIASLSSDAQPLQEILASYRNKKGTLPTSVLIMVGPEGDFTPEETALARSMGASAITLGSIILRTETAALYCLSVLGYELF